MSKAKRHGNHTIYPLNDADHLRHARIMAWMITAVAGIIMFPIVMGSDGLMRFILSAMALGTVGVVWYTLRDVSRGYIVFTPDYMEIRTTDNHSKIVWEQMRGFGWRSDGTIGSVGISLTPYVDETGALRDFIPLELYVFVPTNWAGKHRREVDIDRFLQTDFGREVQIYAPQLFKRASDD